MKLSTWQQQQQQQQRESCASVNVLPSNKLLCILIKVARIHQLDHTLVKGQALDLCPSLSLCLQFLEEGRFGFFVRQCKNLHLKLLVAKFTVGLVVVAGREREREREVMGTSCRPLVTLNQAKCNESVEISSLIGPSFAVDLANESVGTKTRVSS